jgi:hypothetical protein
VGSAGCYRGHRGNWSGICRIMLQRTQRELKWDLQDNVTEDTKESELLEFGQYIWRRKKKYLHIYLTDCGKTLFRHVSSSGVCISCVIQYVIWVWEWNMLYFSADGGLWDSWYCLWVSYEFGGYPLITQPNILRNPCLSVQICFTMQHQTQHILFGWEETRPD